MVMELKINSVFPILTKLNQPYQPIMSITIIGAGLPRTGTNTLKESLEILGYTKTYHMKELLVHPEDLHYWLTLEQTGSTDWDGLYKGFQATVDFPGYPWYKEHMKRYPDAKVILTVRPFEKWHTSVFSTIWQAGPQTLPQKLAMMSKLLFNPRLRSVIKCVKLAKKMIFAVHFQGKFEDKVAAEKIRLAVAEAGVYGPLALGLVAGEVADL